MVKILLHISTLIEEIFLVHFHIVEHILPARFDWVGSSLMKKFAKIDYLNKIITLFNRFGHSVHMD